MCGHITLKSVINFLRDFLHEERDLKDLKLLFIDM